MYEEVVNSIVWYYTKANNSLTAILDTRPPAEGNHLRLHYGIYIESILVAIDYMKDHKLLKDTEIHKFLPSTELEYFRELRNSIVHRGFNPCAGFIVHNEIFYVHTPREVVKRNDGLVVTPPHEPFLLLFLLKVDIIFRELINNKIINSGLLIDKNLSGDDIFNDISAGVKESPYIPTDIKEMFFKSAEEFKKSINPEQIHKSHIQKYDETIKIDYIKDSLLFLIKNLNMKEKIN